MFRTLRGRIASIAALVLAVSCSPLLAVPYCETVRFEPRAEAPGSSLLLFGGNYDARADQPFATIDEAARIDRLFAFLHTRTDGWFVPAGETYEPGSAASIVEIIIELDTGEEQRTIAGLGVNYLETAGCGARVVRVLRPEERAEALNILLGAPIPASLSGR